MFSQKYRHDITHVSSWKKKKNPNRWLKHLFTNHVFAQKKFANHLKLQGVLSHTLTSCLHWLLPQVNGLEVTVYHLAFIKSSSSVDTAEWRKIIYVISVLILTWPLGSKTGFVPLFCFCFLCGCFVCLGVVVSKSSHEIIPHEALATRQKCRLKSFSSD